MWLSRDALEIRAALSTFTPKPSRDTSETYETSRLALFLDGCLPYSPLYGVSPFFSAICQPPSSLEENVGRPPPRRPPLVCMAVCQSQVSPVRWFCSRVHLCVLLSSCHGRLGFISGGLQSYVSHRGMRVCQRGRRACLCVSVCAAS